MRWLLAIALLSGCIQSAEVDCADGRVCPPGNTCDDANQRCISPEQTAACNGQLDGSACSFSGVQGTCRDGACDPLLCGDGVRTGNEECDGNDLGGADCGSAGFYETPGLACTPFCTFDTSGCVGKCGDHIVNGTELCDGTPPAGACVDDGFDAGPLACSASCGASFQSCARFGWQPRAIQLTEPVAIAGTSANDVWVVGNGSAAMHFDGATWSAVPTPDADAVGVWADAPDDAWAVTSNTVEHWDGAQWSEVPGVPTTMFNAVWAASRTAAFVATSNAGVLAWDGMSWQPVGSFPGGAVSALRGSSANDLWAAGSALWHWDGASWTMALGVTASGISVVDSGDVWITGSTGPTFESVIAHWDGNAWTQWVDATAGLYHDITATAPNDVFVSSTQTVLHYDGVAWTESTPIAIGSRGGPAVILAFDPGAVFAVSSDGVVYRYRGQDYIGENSPLSGAINAFWMDSGDDMFIADTLGHVAHFDGSAWTGATTVVDTTIKRIYGTGPDNVWLSAGNELYRYNATNQTWTAMLAASNAFLWGTGPKDMWVLSGPTIQHFDGTTFAPSTTAPNAKAVTGTSSTDIWVCDQTSGVWSFDGMTWHQIPNPPSSNLVAIASTAPGRVVAIDTRLAYAWDGTSWTTQVLPITNNALAIAASAPDFIAVTTSSEIAHFDGTTWSALRPPGSTNGLQPTIGGVVMTPNMLGIPLSGVGALEVRALQRTRPWVCEPTETDCTNGVDDDCDGLIDAQDPDCH